MRADCHEVPFALAARGLYPNSAGSIQLSAADASRYARAGVDIDAGEALVRAIAPAARGTDRPGTLGGLGGFGALFDLKACGFADPVLVAATDGVGTKLLLGLDTGRLDGLGTDLVAMCVNDLVVQGAEPLFFLDYYAAGRLDVGTAARVIGGIARGCAAAGCALIGGETAELPGLYGAGHFDLAGFAVGAVERDAVLPRRDAVAPGDALLGLASSGPHSNGFSLIRMILRESGADLEAPAPFDPGRTLAAALMEPTRLYVRGGLAAIRAGAVKALAHVTGGGITDNLPRALPAGVAAQVDLAAIPLPPLFRWLARKGRLPVAELLRTFNCGIGMVLVVEPAAAGEVRRALEAAGETVLALGTVVAGDGAARVAYRDAGAWDVAP